MLFSILKFSVITSFVLGFSANSAGIKPLVDENRAYEDKDVMLRFVQFTPQQIGSFYEGRGFNKQAVNKLMASCYVTVIVKNKTNNILWVDLDRWEFIQQGQSFYRQSRAYWEQQWEKINLKQAHRSTFGWTLMPDVRNLYPNEGVGGRIPIPMQTQSFTLTLNFPTGDNQQGKVKSITMKNLYCKQDKPKK
ncbi:hypothetical protein MNBD_GAMMA07-2595 [hydrothermal vent metagenome]|uniref:Uncharacterized protein n=1 Tax=hydrothermal vent metagenome TaxID=652676 RepID=A0A3B0WP12_9ZZZZ